MRNLELTIREEAIMLTIVKVPRYGQEIVEAVSAASHGRCQLSPSTLYEALDRLRRRGLIQGMDVPENLHIRKKHNRRYYQVTEQGRQALEDMESIRTYIRGLEISF